MLSEMGEKENPPAAASAAAQTSSLLAAGPGALRQQFGTILESEPYIPSAAVLEAGLGKAQDCCSLLWHGLNGQGEGNWMGHKRDTQRGPPWS